MCCIDRSNCLIFLICDQDQLSVKVFSGNMCNVICNSSFAEVFRRLTHPRIARLLSHYTGNRGIYFSNLKCSNSVANCSQFRLWKDHNFYRGIHVPSASSTTDTSANKLQRGHDPDKFGNFSRESSADLIHDEGDIQEENYITYPVPADKKLRISQYAQIIKEHLSRKDISAAVDVLENRMIKEDRVKPDGYIYSLVINACARYGETKKAFQLYNRMKERGLKVHGSVYTGLFNACANSPNPEDGLRRAKRLQDKLVEKGVELNDSHYHAIMKAYGRSGDLTRAFQVADLMTDKQIPITEEGFNFLLQGCISDTQAGFRYALLVWHKMLQRKIKPSVYSFNLMLRAVRDCNMGEFEEIEKCVQQLTLEPTTKPPVEAIENSRQWAIESGLETLPEVEAPRANQTWMWQLPDLLSPIPRLGCDISQLDLTKPHERLILLGGRKGFLQNMANFRVKPTIKTYTILLDCLPPTESAEKSLISTMKKDGLHLDIDFFNMLIKKRSFRFDYWGAQNVLKLIKEEKLVPDIVTFGVLALACTNDEEAKLLIRNMRQAGYRMNVEILGAMLKQGCVNHNFKYVTKILYIAKEEMVEPSPLFLEMLKRLVASSREILRKMRTDDDDVPQSLQKGSFKKEFLTFLYKYEAWLKEMDNMKKSQLTDKPRK